MAWGRRSDETPYEKRSREIRERAEEERARVEQERQRVEEARKRDEIDRKIRMDAARQLERDIYSSLARADDAALRARLADDARRRAEETRRAWNR